jgi:hypothetical protein
MLNRPGWERMLEAISQVRTLHFRIKPDIDGPPCQFTGEPQGIAGNEPRKVHRESHHLGLTEHPVRPRAGCQGRCQTGTLNAAVDVVEKSVGSARKQKGRNPLSPLLFIPNLAHRFQLPPEGGDYANSGQQTFAGAFCRGVYRVNRRRSVDHPACKGKNQQCHRVSARSVVGEREVVKQFIEKERASMSNFGGARMFRDHWRFEP